MARFFINRPIVAMVISIVMLIIGLVVGGDLAAAGDLLLDGVRSSVRLAALPAAADAARIVAGVLGDRAQVLGALALAVGEADAALDLPASINQPIPGGGVP